MTTPNQPITAPCTKNTRTTPRGSMPSVRNTAMSVVLSVTTMTRLATMLNAATPMIRDNSSDIIIFSMRIARK